MSEVFISYASDDRARAKILAEALEARGLSVWWDRKIVAGEAYDEVIERELEIAKSVVVLWSQRSVVSEWIKNEAQVAVERGTLVPARIDDVRPPLEFRRKQTADLTGWDGDLGHAGFQTLYQGILAHVERALPPKPTNAPLRETKPAIVEDRRRTDAVMKTPTLRRRPKWRVFSWAAIAALLILASLCLWVWDAFYRQHIDYYANVTKRWGLPTGIGQLSAEQVRHRNVTLAFFKDGRRGLVKEIRAVNNRGAYPPQFGYFPPLSLVALNPLSSGLGELLNTSCVSFEYEHGRISKQSAYNRSDRLLYTLAYQEPDYAEYKWEVFSQAVRESGITHLKIVRPKDGPEGGFDKDILFFDNTGTPRPGHDGSYGVRSLFSNLGLVVESIPLDAEAQPTSNSLGIARSVAEYDALGNITKLTNLGVDGRPVVDATGSAETRMRYDQYGNITNLSFFGADGQLVTSKQIGCAERTFTYDDQGNIIENAFFGPDRQLVISSLAFAKQKVVWDKEGASTETFFGADGKPMSISGRAVKLKGIWDKRGHIVEVAYLDENDRLIRSAQGYARVRLDRDEHGNVVALTYLDEGDQPIRDLQGAARIKRKFDQRGNILEEIYFGPNGQLELYEEDYVKARWKYDSQGNETELAYFDARDKPVRNQEGFAKVTYAYDLRGNRQEVVFFNESGQPTVRKGGYAKILRDYDARRNLIEEALLDTEGKPVCGESGWAKMRFTYDERNYPIETSYYDESDRLTNNKEGYAKVRNKFNDKGQTIEWTYFGPDDSTLVDRKHGYAKAIRIFDARGKRSREECFDANDNKTLNAKGYSRVHYFYDEFGREIRREFFGINGERVFTRVTIEKVEPGGKSERVGLRVGDVIIAHDGQEVADNQRFYELELIRGERPRQLTIERFGTILTVDVPAGRLTGIETVDKADAAQAQQDGARGSLQSRVGLGDEEPDDPRASPG